MAKKRVTKLGEHPDRVFVLGSPELDTHKARNSISLNEVLDYYDIDWDNYGIFIFHSVTSELESLKKKDTYRKERIIHLEKKLEKSQSNLKKRIVDLEKRLKKLDL